MNKEEIIKKNGLQPYDLEETLLAMDEYMKQSCLELLEYLAKNDVKCTWYEHEVKGIVYSFHCKGECLSKEQLFENFL